MKIQIKNFIFDSSFEKSFEKYKNKLSDKKRSQLKERIITFKKDPFDKKLKTHKLKGNLKNYWSFSVSYSDRILFRFIDNETVFLVEIGGHNVYK